MTACETLRARLGAPLDIVSTDVAPGHISHLVEHVPKRRDTAGPISIPLVLALTFTFYVDPIHFHVRSNRLRRHH